ncbi:MAG: hypothetical protein JXJ18_02995 [Rhodobacteraceae bacterium]|nr:hypothetical protein [Paracoccaceae bacterium]
MEWIEKSRRAVVFFLGILLAATVQAAAQASPPTVGTSSTVGVNSGNPWTVCRADTNTAWLAANVAGNYNAVAACASVGYSTVTAQGGTCGTVCGYCGTVGREYYDGYGGSTTSMTSTVHWQCGTFVGAGDTDAPTVTITGAPAAISGAQSFTVSVTFSENVVNFAQGDVNVTGGSISAFSGSDDSYSVTIAATGLANVTIAVPAAVAEDGAGNPNEAAVPVTVTLDILEQTQQQRARFALDRANNLLRNQPDLIPFLSGQGSGRFDAQVSRSNGNLDVATSPDSPFWATVSASWSQTDGADQSYLLGALGMHWALTPDFYLGGMVQIDRAEWEDGDATVEGNGWLIGPYFLARLPERPLYIEGRLLFGDSDNKISPLGTFTDSFSSDRMLARLKVAGEVQGNGITYFPNLVIGRTRDKQEGYTDGNGDPVSAQEVRLTNVSYGIDFSMPQGQSRLFGGVSGIWTGIDGSGTVEALDVAYEGMRASVRLGVDHSFDSGSLLRFEGFFDGIGVADYSNYGVELSYRFDF